MEDTGGGVKVGFTGTRRGMTTWQMYAFFEELAGLESSISRQIAEFHHGDCVGADADAHYIVRRFFPHIKITIHPPDNPRQRALKVGDEYRPSFSYLTRNHHIVDETDCLFAAPNGPEVMRSGTWATVRYAKKIGRTVKILERERGVKLR